MDRERLKGKNILITGAAQGMGACNAEYFAAQGANVCLGDVNVDGVNEVAERINAEGNGQAVALKLDVTEREDNAAAVAKTVEAFGSINIALLNAGVNKPRMFMDIDEDNWDMIMNINAKGQLLGMQEAARQMIKQGPMEDHPYKIINVGSIVSRTAFLDVIPYSCSKYCSLALIIGGAKALWEHKITVNGYGPGVVRTELWEQLDRDLVEIGMFDQEGQSMDHLAKTMITMKRYSYPDDVKGTAAFLCSDESDYMTGQLVMIDGGMIMQ
ncbi:SDR family NAD(P)-dependent oxidoreductase [Tranquillimonas alkanivorans]|uniref:Meso-butanediol dehydrogenase / (S,S)-butanediol dehydrogenase / diacetyl reductase n=1 Tax=Tranquillimonas alkanivorans TaxID=441119 RepID=A0A1I5WN44_9RHOB|nr:SDR family oxidoreductase [Tranquillimonas alkanivorans]SFQ21214.1 meso-butanediol dehydrogenase / (S,S)-butanediol dehydrogenase / diacetyl reductase [Tranquillimonas alkanivorans]